MIRTLSLDKEKRMMLAFWLVVFIMIASRQFVVLGNTYLMGEDASCFLNRALEKGLFSFLYHIQDIYRSFHSL